MELVEIASISNYLPTTPENKIRLWTIVLFLSELEGGVTRRGQRISKEDIFYELDEAFWEIHMDEPRTWNDFLFWSWQSKSYDTMCYNHNWQLRYAMMKHHYDRAFSRRKLFKNLYKSDKHE